MKDGSPAATRVAFQTAFSLLSTEQYVETLAQLVEQENIAPVRLTAAAMALGNINSLCRTPGGMPRVNQVLVEMACLEGEDKIDVAKVAIHHLAAINDYTNLSAIVQRAPMTAVAEEALLELKAMRQLPTTPKFIEHRPELMEIYRSAQTELRELHNLVEVACTCPSEDMILFYLSQLKQRNAIPELRHLTTLRTKVGEVAQKILSQIEQSSDA
jgi:hypothetical protein